MKVAVYIEEGIQQVMFMAENDHEKKILSSIASKEHEMSWHNGTWYECQGGWNRITEYPLERSSGYYHTNAQKKTATMLVLREKKKEPSSQEPI